MEEVIGCAMLVGAVDGEGVRTHVHTFRVR